MAMTYGSYKFSDWIKIAIKICESDFAKRRDKTQQHTGNL